MNDSKAQALRIINEEIDDLSKQKATAKEPLNQFVVMKLETALFSLQKVHYLRLTMIKDQD